MPQKTALITGITGQDGSLLAKYLLSLNYSVLAVCSQQPNLWRLVHLGIATDCAIEFINYKNSATIKNVLKENKIDEFYHLAAMTHVGQSHQHAKEVMEVNCLWTIELLNSIQQYSASTRFFFPASSEIFAADLTHLAKEEDCKNPSNPYGISKLAAYQMVKYFREVHGVFACNGILFNHESSLRAASFVSKKIVQSAAKIAKGDKKPLSLGNIYAKKDWGYAPDYVPYFHKMLQQTCAADYVLASGKLHSVKDLVDCAFQALNYPLFWHGEGLDCVAKNQHGETVVNINPRYFRPLDKHFLAGNAVKAQKTLDFKELTPFSSWVKAMTLAEFESLA